MAKRSELEIKARGQVRTWTREQLIIKVSAVTEHIQRAVGRDGGEGFIWSRGGGRGRERSLTKEVALEPH